MHTTFFLRLRHRAVPTRISSLLLLLLQRSPLVNLLPEARVISSSGFARVLQWSITTVTGLCAYDSVSGASTVTQVLPSLNSTTVNATGGQPLQFLFKYGGSDTPDHFQVTGTLPAGLVQTRSFESKTDSITGVPLAVGSFPITVRAWRDAAQSSDSVSANFTINLAAPPAPTITAQPAASNPAVAGGLVHMSVTQTFGFTFTWKKNAAALPPGESILVARTAPRKFLVPATDPGTAWRSDLAFSDASWTSVSGGIGYDTNTSGVNFQPHIATVGGNVQTLMSGSGKSPSANIRIPFSLTNHGALSYLKLRVQCDDGFVAWLNGTEIASQSKPASLLWNSAATNGADDQAAITWRDIDIPQHLGLLRAGDNLLAVQAMNSSNTSSDLLFNCELAAGINATNSPRLVLTGIQPADAGNYTVTVTNPTNTITSNPASLILPPSIVTHPGNVTINSGQTANLSIAAALSELAAYQWYRGNSGDTSTPVAGATSADFITPALTRSESFWARVTNPAGSADSNAAVVTVAVTDPYSQWKTAQFSPSDASNPAVSGPTADPDLDGLTNETEYILGSSPMTHGPMPDPDMTIVAGQPHLSFTASLASGAGYAGRSRLYTIETTTDLGTGSWTDVTGFTDIIGENQRVNYQISRDGNRRFFRLRVRLNP